MKRRGIRGINKRRHAETNVLKREKTCIEEYGVYNRTSWTCDKCEPCGDGRGRDFSDTATLQRGDDVSLICPPCQSCPEGSYNNMKKAVTCSPCRMNCHGLHRQVAKECYRLGDNVCGSCLKGYHEKYHSTGTPCYKNVEPVTLQPIEPLSNGSDQVRDPLRGNDGYQVGTAYEPLKGVDQPRYGTAVLTVGISVIFLAIFVLVIGALVWRIRKSRRDSRDRRRHRRLVEPFSTRMNLITPSASRDFLSHDNDLETDAIVVEDPETIAMDSDTTGKRIAQYQRQHSKEGNFSYRVAPAGTHVRPELSGHSLANPLGARPELSTADLTQPDILAVQVHSICQRQVYRRKHCRCDVQTERHLCRQLLDAYSADPVLRDSDILREVAANVCHDPAYLYQRLGIPESEIYQIDNDRDRNPERITEKENVIKLLKRWVEIKDKEATISVLCQALCESDFHRITDRVLTVTRRET